MQLSVIICTHNPRPDYLRRVLDALKAQTLPKEQWELLLIDNASKERLASSWDLTWHPHARHIHETELGLTAARLRGIRESKADLLVFVDDDNVLDPDYLEKSEQISQSWPILGAWGGQIYPCFEQDPPPEWTRQFWGMLAIRKFDQDRWSNLLHQHETTPCGAGMVVRKEVAAAYAKSVATDVRRASLGRRGNDLSSCEDTDLAFTAISLGLGTGQFARLKMVHLMPAVRLSEPYLLRLTEKMHCSMVVLDSWYGRFPRRQGLLGKALYWLRLMRLDYRSRNFELAKRRGIISARTLLTGQKDETGAITKNVSFVKIG